MDSRDTGPPEESFRWGVDPEAAGPALPECEVKLGLSGDGFFHVVVIAEPKDPALRRVILQRGTFTRDALQDEPERLRDTYDSVVADLLRKGWEPVERVDAQCWCRLRRPVPRD